MKFRSIYMILNHLLIQLKIFWGMNVKYMPILKKEIYDLLKSE